MMKISIVFKPIITAILLLLIPLTVFTQNNETCVDTKNLTDILTSDTYNAAKTINVSSKIAANSQLIFNAGKSITLKEGFHAPVNTQVIMRVKACTTQEKADLVYQNGKIYTANDEQPFAEAIAFKDGVIIFVGDNADVTSFIGTSTIVEDFNGKLMLPGFHDVHMHPLEAGSPIGGGCLLDGLQENPNSLKTALQNCNLSSQCEWLDYGFWA